MLRYVSIVGDSDDNKAALAVEGNGEKNNIMSDLLSISLPAGRSCGTKHVVYFDSDCSEPKLRFSNVILTNFTLVIANNTLIFDNVHFDNIQLLNFAESINPCGFYCNRCLFISNSTNHVSSSEIRNGTENEINYNINFQNCTTVTLQMHQTEIVSSAFYISFLSGVHADISDVNLSRRDEYQTPSSHIILEQLNQTAQDNDGITDKSSYIIFNKFQCFNNSSEEIQNETISRPAIEIVNGCSKNKSKCHIYRC